METVILVEVLGAHDRVRARYRLLASGPAVHCTVGRSAVCDVVLDDPFVAAVHARIIADVEGRICVSDLGSVNGVEIDGRRQHGVDGIPLSDGVLRVGRTRLRVRTAREVLPPEQVDPGGRRWRPRTAEQRLLAAGFAVSVAVTVFEVWTGTARPRDLSTALVTVLLLLLGLAGLWVALWALASRVAFGESRWLRHAMILFVAYALLSVVTLGVEVLNGALGMHLPSSIVGRVLVGLAASVALSSHLLNASPMRARTAVVLGLAIPAVVVAAMLWMETRSQNRSPHHIADDDRMLPPVLFVRRGLPFDGIMAELADLRARAEAKRAFVEREDPSPGEDDPE